MCDGFLVYLLYLSMKIEEVKKIICLFYCKIIICICMLKYFNII